MSDVHVSALSALLTPPVPVAALEVESASEWRAVSQAPGETPAAMAVEAGQLAMAHCGLYPRQFEWLIHTGSGYQGTRSWPVHHGIQAELLGDHGNAIEVRQFCAGGLTSWALGASMLKPGKAIACTAADNWSWTDRFALSRKDGGEPFADAASAVILGPSGFARWLGAGSSSRPAHAAAWKPSEPFWKHMDQDGFRAAYVAALAARGRPTMLASITMIADAIRLALEDAELTPADITHFVPPSSRSGEPYRHLARRFGLPWTELLYQFHLHHGYLSVSAQAGALTHLAVKGELSAGSIVLLVATEYNVSCTAALLQIERHPEIVEQQRVITLH